MGFLEQLANLFNSLIVWNNPFEVDVSLLEKPGGWFAQLLLLLLIYLLLTT